MNAVLFQNVTCSVEAAKAAALREGRPAVCLGQRL